MHTEHTNHKGIRLSQSRQGRIYVGFMCYESAHVINFVASIKEKLEHILLELVYMYYSNYI